jgi:TRAP-type C4-dicarboxylate transport system substrate-binding protein
MDINPIPLSITDVLTSLQTNLINGVYISPLACTALQWHTKVKYMLELPLADSNGAVLITKKQFSKLTPEQQNILKYFAAKYLRQLTQLSREDNAKSLELIKKAGIKFTKITDENQLKSFSEAGKKARQSLVGKLFDQEFLTQAENYILDFRNSK